MGFGTQVLGFGIQGLGFGPYDLGFRAWRRIPACGGSTLRTGPPVPSTSLLLHLPVRGSVIQNQTGIPSCASSSHVDVIQLRVHPAFSFSLYLRRVAHDVESADVTF